MRIVCDLEANGLKPDKIWVICCIDIDKGDRYVFRPETTSGDGLRFLDFSSSVNCWIGHHFLGYDRPALRNVLALDIDYGRVLDTLVVSRLVDSTRNGHSLEDWGVEFGLEKKHSGIEDWSKYTPEMEERCWRDAEINLALFRHLEKYITSPLWQDALKTEHYVGHLCRVLHDNGFAFDQDGCRSLKDTIDQELFNIEQELRTHFPPAVKFVREVNPRLTKFGTIAKNSIPKSLGTDFSHYNADCPFSLIEYVPFNPGSHKQRMDRLWEAGWRPVNKTDTHKDAEKALRQLNWRKRGGGSSHQEKAALRASLGEYGVSGHGKYGWKTDDENLSTLPDDVPDSIKRLARFVLLRPRSGMLQQYLDALGEDGRVHGSFNGIGAWSHRMSHDRPNMGNIPKYNEKRPETTPYSDQMRRLFRAEKDRLLVGVDAESIQLRVFGHYINDKRFIDAVTSGRKEDGSDPHSLNKEALGGICRSRDDAKTFIYAWLLGAGIDKVAAILQCSRQEAELANENFLTFYPGLKYLKEAVVPADAKAGYFKGFDGRFVRIWGDDYGSRCHFALAGYLQCGETVIMKRACQIWYPKLEREKIPFWFVNFVHDEFQIETINDMEVAKYVATTVADSIRQVGVDLGLRCSMAGSILNGHGRLAIGTDWMQTH